MEEQIVKLLSKLEKVEDFLGRAEVLADQKQYRALAQEHSYLSEIKEVWQLYLRIQKQLEENQALIREEKDPEFLEIIREEISHLQDSLIATRAKLENLLV